ncbi:ribosomal protein uL16 3-hydroxylase [Grimontia marina]|uniref:50S ribosomal protein L16 arginine hydroxylase n=1 Tax=Grimontia marina TaxID=646534 RepID=A0A128FHJ2_9GAMM|nr:cupin domain-containing protein [Grimontia marina]CZF86268.1 50S ribosomal protein L16 arginine hydroxylase [Grimontia marina]
MYQLNFDLNDFLTRFWHKEPVVIKNGFIDFEDPISPDEVAGLAMEEEIDSRFVSNLDGNWEVQHGPFESFESFPDTHSQLIVQAANHWHPGPRALSEPFRGLPNWLFDDVMVCLSMPEGGVGPHIDQYDVFICQGMGKRRWRVGDKGEYKDANHHTGLRQIEGFDPIIDEILEPGDILYIPPGFPHEGNTIEVSLSYSVGYRSPKKQELLNGFADFVLTNELGDKHFYDPNIQTRDEHGMIPTAEYNALNDMLMKLINDEDAKARWMGEQLSQSRHELDIMPADPPWQSDELQQFMEDGLYLEKVSGLKALYHENNPSLVFINGETIELPEGCEAAAKVFCDMEYFSGEDLGAIANNPALLALLLDFCNEGLWYPQA